MMLDWPQLIKMSAEWQFKVGTKATLILDSRPCGWLRSPRAIVYSATLYPALREKYDIVYFSESTKDF